MRFSIANLLAAEALVGIGLAALKSPNSSTAALLLLTTVVVILFSVLGTIHRTGEARAFEYRQLAALRETLNQQDARRRITELRERELRGGAIITPAPMIVTPRLERLDEPRRAKDE